MKYTKEILREAVKHCTSFAQVSAYINGRVMPGSTQTHIANLIRKHKIDHSHFLHQGSNKGKPPKNKRSAKEILVKRTQDYKDKRPALKRALLEIGREYICSECQQEPFWNNKNLVLQIDHINGDCMDNRAKNLRFLCPNCHTQTVTYSRAGMAETR